MAGRRRESNKGQPLVEAHARSRQKKEGKDKEEKGDNGRDVVKEEK